MIIARFVGFFNNEQFICWFVFSNKKFKVEERLGKIKYFFKQLLNFFRNFKISISKLK